MGKNGIVVILFVGIFSLAILPVMVDDSFGGPIITPPFPPPPPGDEIMVILFPAPGALPGLPPFPGDPLTPLLGDFKCYLVGNDIDDEEVILIDQFEERDYFVKGITEICNFVLKSQNVDVPFPPSQVVDPTNGGIPNQHYKVYDIRCIGETPTGQPCTGPIMEDVLLRDQFGDTRHIVLESIELWVPQAKFHLVCPQGFDFNPNANPGFECQTDDPQLPCNNPFVNVIQSPPFCVGPPTTFPFATLDTEIHWKCYEVDPQSPDQRVLLGLNDLNFGTSDNLLLDLYKICTPVEKLVCMDGYEFTPEGLCQDITGGPTSNVFPISSGDSTIDDHLKCYRINHDESFLPPDFGVQYQGQFGTHDFFAPDEWEVCLVASKLHIPESAIGGSFIPIDSALLILLGAQTTASWLIPVIISAVGIGLVILRRR